MKNTLFLFCSLFFLQTISAQHEHRDSLIRKWNTKDTNYIRSYPDRFIFTLSTSYREYDIDFTQTLKEDTLEWGHPILKGSTSQSYGASIDFDKVSFSFGLGSKVVQDAYLKKYGQTDYTALNLSFGFYRFRVESNYRNLHGMYDTKTPYYDTSGIFWQNSSMNLRSIRVKTLFIFNKKHFSYNSAYYNTQRQLKSSHSVILVNNIYNYRFTADTSFLPPASRPYFGQFADLNYFNVNGISIGPGYSFNLVIFKTLYFNTTFLSGFDFQHRDYNGSQGEHIAEYWHVGFAGDLRLAFGLNGKRMFTSLTGRWDTNNYLGDGIRFAPTYLAVDFNIGYRFPIKQKSWVKKMKDNKWYQML
ncbi:hypothetical protein BH09BAC5_BH09BAC5_13160 [soil metagenome]